ncbi:hydrolase [Dictyobacter sp. S3.2.2.5]|uniref:Hydrolase n=1 Tax=Dictyobacter halimunensis TaxID=3026934 RepID=A0ABQ6FSR5_9CHLR|nr:hydrolase [Dictyobacter sp. S3.2.2.5]
MQHWICVTCGTQFASSEEKPESCPICLDQRQYVGPQGQQWTTLEEMRGGGEYSNTIKQHEPGLVGIGTTPKFAIGQRGLLVRSEQGNVLWDCITYLDDETYEAVKKLGGISAIAISHPHYYSTMVQWAERFDATIYLHEDDRQWVMRPDERIVFWSGETQQLPGDITLVRLGGHFPGGTVLHWPQGADGKGALLTGDIITVVVDRRWVSFMYSYPNLIPLPATEVARIRDAIKPYTFDRIYGAWFETIVHEDAHNAVIRSADRYIEALQAVLPIRQG